MPFKLKSAINHTNKPMIDAGIVVHIIECICLNILTLVTSAAKLVVSDNGDILSPNTAPAIIAPAAIPGGIPN